MATEIPDKLTEVTPAEFYAALRELTHGTTEPLGRTSLLVLAAQFAFETGGGKACHCFNLGNVKCPPSDTVHDYTLFRCSEIIGGKEIFFDPPNPACRFRAFQTLEQGAADYYAEMRHQFASAWSAVVAGDPDAFAAKLKAAHYYTADEAVYAAGLRRWYAYLDEHVAPEPDPAAQAAADSAAAANANQTAVAEQFNPETDHDEETDPA